MLEAYSRKEDVFITGDEFTSADGRTKVKIRSLEFQKPKLSEADEQITSTAVPEATPMSKDEFTVEPVSDPVPNTSASVGDKREMVKSDSDQPTKKPKLD